MSYNFLKGSILLSTSLIETSISKTMNCSQSGSDFLSLDVVLAENVSDGVVVIDLDENIRFVNTVMAKMHGYISGDALIGKKISVFHSEYQMKADVLPMIEEVKQRGRLWGPVDHLRNNETAFPTQTKMILLKDGHGTAVGLFVIVTDMTKCIEMKKSSAQQSVELSKTNEQLRQQTSEYQKTIDQLKEQVDELNAKLGQHNQWPRQQIHEHHDFDQSEMKHEEHGDKSIGSHPLWNEQKLRDLASLANRLAGKRSNTQ